MAYYGGRGDYYRGDYYRGDPIFGLPAVGKLASMLVPKVVKVGKSLLGIGKRVGPVVGAAAGTAVATRVATPPPPPPGQIPVPGMKGRVQRILPGGATGFMPARRRRMNPTNPRALRRALRRVTGFAKLAQRTKRDIGRAATAAGVRRSGAAGKKRR